MQTLKITEMHPRLGDTVATMTLEEARTLEFDLMSTIVLPTGKEVRSFDELVNEVGILDLEEVEVLRFPVLVGG